MKKKDNILMQEVQEFNIEEELLKLVKSSPFIKVNEKKTGTCQTIPRPINYNKQADFDTKGVSRDLDELNAYSGNQYVLDSHEFSFDRFQFNQSEGCFKYDHIHPKYWDILAYPPIKEIKHDLEYYSKHYSKAFDNDHELLTPDFNKMLNELTQTDVSFGNTSELLLNGDFFSKKIELIKSAKKFILASNMFLTGDYTQTLLYDLLEEKIKEGIPVYYILDKVFALKYNKAFKRLEAIGVQVFYLDNGFKMKNRTIYHTKFWVVDNEDAIVYGANLIDAQINADGFNGGYRDNGVYVTGPVVRDLSSLFIETASHFNSKSASILKPIKETTQLLIQGEVDSGLRGVENLGQKGMMRVVFQGQHSRQTNVTDLYSKLISTAKSHIHMTNVRSTIKMDFENDRLTAKITQELLDKANDENVRVDILTNNYLTATDVKSVNYKEGGLFTWLYKRFVKREDMRAVTSANRKEFKEKSKNGLYKIWHYFQFTHAKVLSVDSTANVFGSYNLNKLSTDSSYEIALVVYDADFSEKVNEMIVRDLMNSIPILRGRDD